jgi:DnaD/phage-associated family protein
MSKTILTKVDGFTPVIDSVMKETSLITAVVFGRIWRYCQMENGVCQATLEKISDGVGLSRQAVIDHIKKLEENGYIEDQTPSLRNRPHTYRDTGKAGLYMTLSAVNVVDSAVNVVDSQSQPGVLEDSLKKESKTEDTTTATTKNIFKVYENEIGTLTPAIAEKIGLWIDDNGFPNDYITDAIKEAALQNKRNWAYIEAILRRWKVDGKQAKIKESQSLAHLL